MQLRLSSTFALYILASLLLSAGAPIPREAWQCAPSRVGSHKAGSRKSKSIITPDVGSQNATASGSAVQLNAASQSASVSQTDSVFPSTSVSPSGSVSQSASISPSTSASVAQGASASQSDSASPSTSASQSAPFAQDTFVSQSASVSHRASASHKASTSQTAAASHSTGTSNSPVQTGDGTFYATGLGACGITNKDTDFIAAVSHQFFDSYPGATANPNDNPICGKKAQATYNGKSVTVTITDRCGGCRTGTDLDFSPSAFSQLADQSVGRIEGMKWQIIS